jgi:hypothetical protein
MDVPFQGAPDVLHTVTSAVCWFATYGAKYVFDLSETFIGILCWFAALSELCLVLFDPCSTSNIRAVHWARTLASLVCLSGKFSAYRFFRLIWRDP